MKLFNPDSRIMIFLSRVADLVILNILWLVCCIPVVTIGASTTAMYHVIRHWQKDSVSSIMRDFFQSFKEDFKQATPVYLILLIPTVAVVMNAMLIFNPENSAAVPSYLLVIWFISALILLFISSSSIRSWPSSPTRSSRRCATRWFWRWQISRAPS